MKKLRANVWHHKCYLCGKPLELAGDYDIVEQETVCPIGCGDSLKIRFLQKFRKIKRWMTVPEVLKDE